MNFAIGKFIIFIGMFVTVCSQQEYCNTALGVDCGGENMHSFQPNPEDCTSYCQCTPVGVWKIYCPNGTVFNTLDSVCDENLRCVYNRRLCPVEVQCPLDNVILANPNDCRTYCKCEFGWANWIPCPDGLLFNQNIQVCDWPYNVNCNNSKK